LVMAVGQIIPEGHSPAFSTQVDLGQRVSWGSDDNWQKALKAALLDVSLGFRVEDTTVHILKLNEMAMGTTHVKAVPEPVVASNPVTVREPIVRREALNVPDTMSLAAPESNLPDAMSFEPVSATPDAASVSSVSDTMPLAITQHQKRSPVVKFSGPRVEPFAETPMPLMNFETEVKAKSIDQAQVQTQTQVQPGNQAQNQMQSEVMAGKWVVNTGETLRETLQHWSMDNGSKLYWLIDYDYKLKKSQSFDGSYEQAVQSLLDQFVDVQPRPYGQLYRSADKGNTLTIKAYDSE